MLQGFSAQFAAINQQLEQLGDHSRRTGASVGSGAREGAQGLTQLATAGLEAFGALKGLQSLYEKLTGTAAGGAAIGRILPEIGASSTWAQSFANYGQISTGANPMAMLEDMRRLEMDLQALKRGVWAPRFTELGKWGPAVQPGDTVESLMPKITRSLEGKSPATAQSLAEAFGFSTDTGRVLRQGSAAIAAGQQQVSTRNLTNEQIESMTRLNKAELAAGQAWEHLWQVMSADSAPILTRFLELFTSVADALSHDTVALHATEIGIVAVSIAMTGGLVGALGAVVRALAAISLSPITKAFTLLGLGGALRFLGPLGLAAGAGALAYEAFGRGSKSGGGSNVGGIGGPDNWETQHNNFAGIRRAGITAGPNSGGFEAYATPQEGINAIGGLLDVYQTKHGLNTLRGMISRWAPPNENPTEDLIARASKVTGLGPDQPFSMNDPAMRNKVIEAFIRNEQGGRLPTAAAGALGISRGSPSADSAVWKVTGNDRNKNTKWTVTPPPLSIEAQHALDPTESWKQYRHGIAARRSYIDRAGEPKVNNDIDTNVSIDGITIITKSPSASELGIKAAKDRMISRATNVNAFDLGLN